MKNNVLVVDDVDGVRRELGYLLEDEGYSVMQAENGEKACSLLMKNKFDVVITDILMPEMDGFELIVISGGGRLYVNNIQGVNDLLRQVEKIIKPEGLLKKPFESEYLLEQMERLLKESTK